MKYTHLINNLKTRFDTLERYFTDDDDRQATLQAVWSIGRDVYQYTRETGKSVKAIATDVGTPGGTLEKYVRLYKVFPQGCQDSYAGEPVTLSHYLALIYIHDKDARDFYIRAAAKGGWSSHQLRRRVRNNYYEHRQDAASTRTTASGAGPQLHTPNQQLYTYAAKVVKVVDADTLELDIDVGFKTQMRHKVRLRGINCPERGTKKGEAAKAFVEQALNAEGGNPAHHTAKTGSRPQNPEPARPRLSQVVVRTYKSGKFGRYIADVWYSPVETDREAILTNGILLNQELLNHKFAEVVE